MKHVSDNCICSASRTVIRGGGELAAGVAPDGVPRDHKGVPKPAVVGDLEGLREEVRETAC